MIKLVLIIESDAGLRSSLFELFETQGFNVISTENISSGFNLVKEFKPDLILCDIDLSHLQEFWILNELSHDLKIAKIPFIFISSKSDLDKCCLAMQLGTNDYLKKTVNPNELLEVIADQLQLFQAGVTNI